MSGPIIVKQNAPIIERLRSMSAANATRYDLDSYNKIISYCEAAAKNGDWDINIGTLSPPVINMLKMDGFIIIDTRICWWKQ
jgi:hypothetical protein